MKNKIEAAINRNGHIVVIGVDPAMSKPCGIAIIRFHLPSQKAEPIITRTFQGTKHGEIVDYFTEMKARLLPDEVVAIGSEEGYQGKYRNVDGAVNRSRGIIEGVAACKWSRLIVLGFGNSEWKKTAFGSSKISKSETIMACEADFRKHPDAAIIGDLSEHAAEAYWIAVATAIRLVTE